MPLRKVQWDKYEWGGLAPLVLPCNHILVCIHWFFSANAEATASANEDQGLFSCFAPDNLILGLYFFMGCVSKPCFKCPDLSILPRAFRGFSDQGQGRKAALFAVAFILLHSLSQMNAITFTATLSARQKYAASNMPWQSAGWDMSWGSLSLCLCQQHLSHLTGMGRWRSLRKSTWINTNPADSGKRERKNCSLFPLLIFDQK